LSERVKFFSSITPWQGTGSNNMWSFNALPYLIIPRRCWLIYVLFNDAVSIMY